MNESLQNKLSEVIGANNISYILRDNKDFSVTGYKVMQNQGSSGLLRCAKLMYNGKIKLVYIIDDNKPLSYVATRLGVNELNAVIFNLIQRAMDIKANGFFRAENLELDFNKIFVDTADYSVHLVYFPISGGSTGKISAFENEFRVALISLFNSFPVFNAPQFQRLCSDLANGSLPLDVILKKLQDNINGNHNVEFNQIRSEYPASRAAEEPIASDYSKDMYYQQERPCRASGSYGQYGSQIIRPVQQVLQPVLTVTSINSPVHVTLSVNQPEFLIGKNPNMVDGAVIHNPAISRIHCKITFVQGKYYLTDVGSANGTFINQQKIDNQQMVEIKNGDYLKLANSEFIISF